ncbi:MAG: hypothetical protein ACK5JT_13440, partial [Hyphomicrobiaceae bacterium]
MKGRLAKLGIGLAAVTLVAALGLCMLVVTSWGQNRLVQLGASFASDANTRIEIGTVEGSLLSSATLDSIEMRDAKGAWLRIEGVALDWRPMALLSGTIQVDKLHVAKVDVLRLPEGAAGQDEKPAASPDGKGGLPRLPPIALGDLRIGLLHLRDTLPSGDTRLKIVASVLPDRSSDRLDGKLSIVRIDGHEGHVAAKIGYSADQQRVSVHVDASEPDGGLVATLLGLPDKPAFMLNVSGDGPLDDWHGRIAAHGGEQFKLDGTATISRNGQGRAVTAALNGRIDGVLPAGLRALLGGDLSARLDGRWNDSGHVVVNSARVSSSALKLAAQGVADPKRRFIHGSLDLRIANADGEPVQIALDPDAPITMGQAHFALGLAPASENRRVTLST